MIDLQATFKWEPYSSTSLSLLGRQWYQPSLSWLTLEMTKCPSASTVYLKFNPQVWIWIHQKCFIFHITEKFDRGGCHGSAIQLEPEAEMHTVGGQCYQVSPPFLCRSEPVALSLDSMTGRKGYLTLNVPLRSWPRKCTSRWQRSKPSSTLIVSSCFSVSCARCETSRRESLPILRLDSEGQHLLLRWLAPDQTALHLRRYDGRSLTTASWFSSYCRSLSSSNTRKTRWYSSL